MRFRIRFSWVWADPYGSSIFSHMYVRHEAVTVFLHHWKESLMYSKRLVTFLRSGNYGFFSFNINYKHISLTVSFPVFVRVFLIRSAYSCCGCYFVAVVVHKYRLCCCCCCCHQHLNSIWIVTQNIELISKEKFYWVESLQLYYNGFWKKLKCNWICEEPLSLNGDISTIYIHI